MSRLQVDNRTQLIADSFVIPGILGLTVGNRFEHGVQPHIISSCDDSDDSETENRTTTGCRTGLPCFSPHTEQSDGPGRPTNIGRWVMLSPGIPLGRAGGFFFQSDESVRSQSEVSAIESRRVRCRLQARSTKRSGGCNKMEKWGACVLITTPGFAQRVVIHRL
jgi:hypothetical protein